MTIDASMEIDIPISKHSHLESFDLSLAAEEGMLPPASKKTATMSQQLFSEAAVLVNPSPSVEVSAPLLEPGMVLQTYRNEALFFIDQTFQRLEQTLFVLSSLFPIASVDNVRGRLLALRTSHYALFTSHFGDMNQAIAKTRDQIAELLKDLDPRCLDIINNFFYNTFICPESHSKNSVVCTEMRNVILLAKAKSDLQLNPPYNVPRIISVFLRLGLIEEAIALKEKSTDDDIDNDLLLHDLSLALVKIGNYERARAYALQSSEFMRPAILESIAEKFVEQGLVNQAFDVAFNWDRGSDGSPTKVERALVPIVHEFARRGQFEQALALTEKIEDSSDSKCLALGKIISALAAVGRYKEVEPLLNQLPDKSRVAKDVRCNALKSITSKLVSENLFEEALAFIYASAPAFEGEYMDLMENLNVFELILEGMIKTGRLREVIQFINVAMEDQNKSYASIKPYQNRILAWVVEKFLDAGHLDEALEVAHTITDVSYNEKELAITMIVKKLVELDRIPEAIALTEKREATTALRQAIIVMARKGRFDDAAALMEKKIKFASDRFLVQGWIAIEMAKAGFFEKAFSDAHSVVQGMKALACWQLDENAFFTSDWWLLPFRSGAHISQTDEAVTHLPVRDLLGRIVEEMIKAGQLSFAYAALKDTSEEDCPSKINLLNSIALGLIKHNLSGGCFVAQEISAESARSATFIEIAAELCKVGNASEAKSVLERYVRHI